MHTSNSPAPRCLVNYQILHAQKLSLVKTKCFALRKPTDFTPLAEKTVRELDLCFDPVRLFWYLTVRLTQSTSTRRHFQKRFVPCEGWHGNENPNDFPPAITQEHTDPPGISPVLPQQAADPAAPPDRHLHTPAANEAFFLVDRCWSRKSTKSRTKPTQPGTETKTLHPLHGRRSNLSEKHARFLVP